MTDQERYLRLLSNSPIIKTEIKLHEIADVGPQGGNLSSHPMSPMGLAIMHGSVWHQVCPSC